MTARERFRAVWTFQPTDRPWRFEALGFWTETLAAWRRDGLPRWVTSDPRAFAHFGYDRWIPVVVGDHIQPNLWPPFARRRVSSDGDTEVWQAEHGGLERVFAGRRSALPQTVRPLVSTMDDFRAVLPRLDPDAPGRLRSRMDRLSIGFARLRRYPLGAIFCGLFGAGRHLLGAERYLLAFYRDPELLHAIGAAWERLVIGVGRRLAREGAVWAGFWEDMCYRSGMFISPDSYREFIAPYFRRAVAALYDAGFEFTWVDSDGDVTRLIPLIEEVGIKGMMPFEVQAGMDIVQVRRDHPRLVLIGGLDKRLLARGRETMEAELQQKAVPLLSAGGYIPGLDHAVPPDVSLADFRWFMGRLRSKEFAAYGR